MDAVAYLLCLAFLSVVSGYQWTSESVTGTTGTPGKMSSQGGRMTIGSGTRFRLDGHRLEVNHNGRWGTVCDDDFNEGTASGVCFLINRAWPTYARFYNQPHTSTTSLPLLLDQLECRRDYYYNIPMCTANYWGVNDCTHAEDVYIDCIYQNHEMTTFDYDSSSQRGQMSIPQGTSFRLDGQRLDVYHNGRWGTVCDDGFTPKTTRDICKLIYGKWPSYSTFYSGRQTGFNTNPIWLDQLECRNTLYYGVQCSANNWGVNDCSHSEDVYIDCQYTDRYEMTTMAYELSSWGGQMSIPQGTSFRLDGQRLEVYHNGRWGTVCDDGFTQKTTRDICKLIYGQWPSYFRFYNQQQANYGLSTSSSAHPIWLDQLECRNTLYNGVQCSANNWGVNDCSPSENVYIECQFTDRYEMTTVAYDLASRGGRMSIPQGTSFRLDGQRLEVYHNGRWGTVCDDGFTQKTTRDICKLIYGQWPSYLRFYNQQQASYGSSTYSPAHQIWLDQLECVNTFYNGVQCTANNWGVNDCSNSEDVYIECQFTDPYEYTTDYNIATALNSAAPHYSSGVYVSSITVGCYPDAWNIRIYLPDLYKRHSDFDPSDIYLGQPGCQGYRYGNYLRIEQQYSNCDTHHFTTPNRVEYTNTLVYAYRDANYKFIIRDYRFRIDVQCDMATHETVSEHFIETHNQMRVRSSNPQISNTGHYNIRMAFYRDSAYQQQLYGSPLTVDIGDDIYVSVTTPLSDYDIKMNVESCYTLPSPSAGDRLKLFLIHNGCTSDVSAHIVYRSSHETRFVFQDFEYSTDQNNLYLFCTATFCNVTDYSSACDQSCHRVKRETVESPSEVHVRRADTSDVLRLTKGRTRRDVKQEDTEPSGRTQYISVDDHLFIAVIVSAVGISVIAIFVAIRRYKKPRSKLIDTI